MKSKKPNVVDVAVRDCKKSSDGKHDWRHSQGYWFYCRHCLAQAIAKQDYNTSTKKWDIVIEVYDEVRYDHSRN